MKHHGNFSASFMSNAKWRRFFEVCAAHAQAASDATWKLVDEAEPICGHLPALADIWEDAVDGCLNGPVDYERIEWIEIPRHVPHSRYAHAPPSCRSQDIEALSSALEAAAKFRIEITADSLRIYGYG